MSSHTPRDHPPRIVHLLGIMPRSGTNYLCDLLSLHPDCGATVHITENFLFAHAHTLCTYVDQVHNSWQALWGEFGEELKAPLLAAIGEGLENYLYGLTEPAWVHKYISPQEVQESPYVKTSPPVCISRTPSVENLALIPRLTGSKVILLVRDGRSVIESGMRSFGWWYEDALHRWAKAADTILQTAPQHPDQMHTVRYEDLLQNKKEELWNIFTFIGIDPEIYDYEREPPVRGSSTFHSKPTELNWRGAQRTKSFDPLKRWRRWKPARHARFNWVAGKQLRAFGYEPVSVEGLHWKVYNLIFDALWPLWTPLRQIARKIIPQELRGKILWQRGIRYRKTIINKNASHKTTPPG